MIRCLWCLSSIQSIRNEWWEALSRRAAVRIMSSEWATRSIASRPPLFLIWSCGRTSIVGPNWGCSSAGSSPSSSAWEATCCSALSNSSNDNSSLITTTASTAMSSLRPHNYRLWTPTYSPSPIMSPASAKMKVCLVFHPKTATTALLGRPNTSFTWLCPCWSR